MAQRHTPGATADVAAAGLSKGYREAFESKLLRGLFRVRSWSPFFVLGDLFLVNEAVSVVHEAVSLLLGLLVKAASPRWRSGTPLARPQTSQLQVTQNTTRMLSNRNWIPFHDYSV